MYISCMYIIICTIDIAIYDDIVLQYPPPPHGSRDDEVASIGMEHSICACQLGGGVKLEKNNEGNCDEEYWRKGTNTNRII